MFYATYPSGSWQLVWGIVTEQMVSLYIMSSYISDKLRIPFIVSGM